MLPLGMTLGLTNRPDISGLTCPAAIPLVSGVAASVSVPSGDRWYRIIAAETGVLSTAFTLTGGTGTITGYKNGSCASLPASSFTASATAFPTTNINVTAGDVVRIKVSQSTGTLAGSLTLTAYSAANISAATTTDGLGIAFTFPINSGFGGNSEITVVVDGTQRWTLADGTNVSGDGTTTVTVEFATPAIAHGDTITVISTGNNFYESTNGTYWPDFSKSVTNNVP